MFLSNYNPNDNIFGAGSSNLIPNDVNSMLKFSQDSINTFKEGMELQNNYMEGLQLSCSNDFNSFDFSRLSSSSSSSSSFPPINNTLLTVLTEKFNEEISDPFSETTQPLNSNLPPVEFNLASDGVIEITE
mmetsp:Transcript_18780/g.22299  ORF Transcript_18780/g.22299 Transcript_18780/m.22299 type:complete len:131 (-) Transcript_18780:138-530(-)